MPKTLIAVLFAVSLLSFEALFAAEAEPRGPSLGIDLQGSPAPEALAARNPSLPMDVRIVADWATAEPEGGAFDWSSIAPMLSELAGRGMRITLCVRGESPHHPREAGELPDAAWLAAWGAVLRSAVKELGPQLAAVEIGEHPERSFDPVAYAFVLKSASLAVKAEAKTHGLQLLVAQGTIGADSLEWQQALWQNDAAPYVDILPVAFDADVAAGVARFSAEAVLHPPAAALRAQITGDASDPWSSYRGAVAALSSSAPSALVTLPEDLAQAAAVAGAVANIQTRLAAGYAPAPPGGLAVRRPEGGAMDGAAVLGRFFHAKDFTTIVVYQAPLTDDPEGQARLLLDTIDVKEPAIVDLLTDASYKTGPAQVPGERGKALRLLLADHPMAAVWERASENQPGLDVSAEDVDVPTTRGLTAEEIIAKNRQVQKYQDDHLERWVAKGRADIHFKFAQGGGSVELGIDSTYFWRRGAALEWQQKRYYVNGNLVRWKQMPELPLIQPEKVATLPLDLTFDKSYAYTLAGEDTVKGRDAYIIAFEPAGAATDTSSYRGRVWIDKESFVRLRTSMIQTHLEPPVLQNEETDTYVPVTGPDGATYIVIGHTDGQQLWSGGGRNFVVRRELTLSEFEINTPEDKFDQALRDAYASDDQMLRDTENGFRYLEKDATGGRVVQPGLITDAFAGLAGVFKDDATGGVLPAIGVNWFDSDFLGKKIQFDVFFAVAYAFVNLTDPSVGGTKLDLGVEASLLAIKLDEKFFVNGVEDLSQRIRRRSQYVSGRLGYPLGSFFKMSLIGDFAWNTYDSSSDASGSLASANQTFVLPVDHQVYAGTLQFEFNRIGYSIAASGTASQRSSWERWGLFDIASSTFVDPAFDPDQRSFVTWKLTAFKEWYLPKFQKLKAEIDYLDGTNLDRFSQYQFGRFGGESLEGFSGTGVRFDTGVIARGGWSFNIANAVSFGVAAEFARVRDRLEDDRFRDHFGAGLSFNVVGPWMTWWRASYGRAITSDVPALEGKQEFTLTILKLFQRGLKRKRTQ